MRAGDSPYTGVRPTQWLNVTERLLKDHPLDGNEIVELLLRTWDSILSSGFGSKPFMIGRDLYPRPQIVAFLMHELVPLELKARYPSLWRGDLSSGEKDLVYIPDEQYSVEIKASSHPTQIFGNRSYAQKSAKSKKQKSGYYLAVNFEKIEPANPHPKIVLVRFGWLDHKDWIGQKSPTGQQARLSPAVERGKLAVLYCAE